MESTVRLTTPGGDTPPGALLSIRDSALARTRAWVERLGLPTQLAIAFFVLHALWMVLDRSGPAAHELVGNLWFVPVGISIAGMAFLNARDSRLHRGVRRGWMFLAFGYVLLWLSTNTWAADDVFFAGSRRLQWLMDAVAAGFFPAVLTGLFMFPRAPRTRTERAKMLLDLATVFVGASTLIWYVMLRPRHLDLFDMGWPMFWTLTSPAGELAQVMLIASILMRGTDRVSEVALRLVAVGQLVSIVGDLVYTPLQIANSYKGGHPIDSLWMLGDLLVFCGAAYQQRHGMGAVPPRVPRAERYARLPYLFVVAGFLPVLVASTNWENTDRAVLYAVVLITVLVLARQFAALRDNERLSREQRMQEARFRSLVQHASDVITVVDADGIIRYQSASVERLLGYPSSLHHGEALSAIVHPDDHAKVEAFLADARAPGARTGSKQWRVCHGNGSWIQLETVATNMLQDPAVAGIVLNSRDVSERAGLEAQLVQAQKMEAVGRLAGGIAHDFNNLLTAIRMTATLVIDELPRESPFVGELREIERSVDRGAALTRQLLAFSRRDLMQPTLIDAAEVVAGLEPMLRRLIAKDVTLVVDAPLQPWRVLADRGQLEQVIMNLALNARDAMPEHGMLNISVGTTSVNEDMARANPGLLARDYVMITVSDTGSGMTEEVKKHLFEPFFTTKDVGQGTGLGLSTVYAIVQQCGGAVSVDSREGEGATFIVYLPRAAADAVAARAVAPTADSTGGREMILVVDDEETVRISVRRILQKYGYAVIDAGDGAAALELLATHGTRISLLLTDMVMPTMGGRELIEHAAAMIPRLRIVVMSGYTEDTTLQQGELAGEHAFIAKPFTVDDLAATVRRALDGAPTPDASSLFETAS
jgi:PAS domain S-box-containing protein